MDAFGGKPGERSPRLFAVEGIHVDLSSWKYAGWRGQLCEEARERREKPFLHVNNRLEGNALETIPGILALAKV